MEKIKTKSIYEKLFISFISRFKKGHLKLTLASGEKITIGDGNGVDADLNIVHDDFYKKFIISGDIGFGESFCDGDWSTSDLTQLLRWAIQNVETSGIISGSKVKNFSVNLLGHVNKLGHYLKKNNKKGSQKNISYHYDLSNKFYEMMLDETMMYSCAIFEEGNSDLKEAQYKKLKTLCDDLHIKPGDHILEIGCGWGGFATYAVTHHDCKVTGVTISKEQYDYATQKVKALGLEDKITILLKDYRDLKGKYDKIISIEMIEAVGHEFLPKYFQKIDSLLCNDGVAVIQAITSPDSRYDFFRKGVDFIQKHIFPGSLLPSIRAMTKACAKTDLHIFNLRDIGLHYAKTLRNWDEKIELEKDKIRELGMDDTFFRKWKYYLCYCEAAFTERNISDIQLTLIKPNNTTYRPT
ncbi:MAG: class I SAM-dependent methyltransferase [Bacteriovoracaceae bacterium]